MATDDILISLSSTSLPRLKFSLQNMFSSLGYVKEDFAIKRIGEVIKNKTTFFYWNYTWGQYKNFIESDFELLMSLVSIMDTQPSLIHWNALPC